MSEETQQIARFLPCLLARFCYHSISLPPRLAVYHFTSTKTLCDFSLIQNHRNFPTTATHVKIARLNLWIALLKLSGRKNAIGRSTPPWCRSFGKDPSNHGSRVDYAIKFPTFLPANMRSGEKLAENGKVEKFGSRRWGKCRRKSSCDSQDFIESNTTAAVEWMR